MKDVQLPLPALTAIITLTVAEAVYLAKDHKQGYKDMLSSIGLVLGRAPISAITNGITVSFYTLVYQFRLFTLPASYWWAWVLCFFCDDFSFYWFHRCSHQVRFLWASHKVHHSSEKFTFASGLRVPWTSDITGNFLFWAWMPLIGIHPYMVLFMKSASVAYQFWMHTETIKKLPKWFEAIFNTPSHHRVHHSSDVEYLDKNHGGILIVWDKLFGTYQEEIFKPKYGLTEDINSFNPFVIAFHEWKKILKDLRKSGSVKDKLRYLFKPPGWSHDGATKTTTQLQSDMDPGKNNKFPPTKL